MSTLIGLLQILPAHAADAPAQPHQPDVASAVPVPVLYEKTKMETIWEWDPYYTDVGLHIPLTQLPIPTISSDNEIEIYSKLIEGSFIPRYMLLEASVYPMPVLGTYLKTHAPGFYRQGQLGTGGINFFDSATAGFQEPWAVSAFFGNIASLDQPGEKREGVNLGYTGYLISAGTKHIKDNTMIDDHWYELEWKIKGKRDYADEKLGWSFRVGGKFHANPDITDVVYFSIHRSNLNARFPLISWLNNTNLEFKTHFSTHTGRVVHEEFVVGKKFPRGKDYTATLDIGLVWKSPDEYAGLLRDSRSTLTLVFRPSVEF